MYSRASSHVLRENVLENMGEENCCKQVEIEHCESQYLGRGDYNTCSGEV